MHRRFMGTLLRSCINTIAITHFNVGRTRRPKTMFSGWIIAFIVLNLCNSQDSTLQVWVCRMVPTVGSRISHCVFNVRQSYCARYRYRLSVCPSLRLSVTRLYCVETAQPIVKLSSLPGSPMILVFWGPNFFPEFQWEHPNGGVKCKGYEKVAISNQYLAIARKRLKIDMLQCLWPALNPLSIHVTFTAILSQGCTQGRPKVQKCAKMANFWTYGLNYWETVEDRWT